MQDAINLLKEAEREIFRLQDAWSSTKESDALRKKIRKFVAAQQSFALDGSNVRPYCRIHEINYDFKLGCPACTTRK